MRKVVCLVNMAALLVGFLGGSVLKFDISGVTKKKREISGFELQVMLGGYLCVSGFFTLQLSCGTIYKIS